MRYEETVVVSPGGWTTRATIHEVGSSPGGTSERILRSQSYNFKNGADNETEEQRKAREAVKRNARRRAITDRFDEEKTEAKKNQRRKGAALTPAPLARSPLVLQRWLRLSHQLLPFRLHRHRPRRMSRI